jgi:murein DD-endopeptidase MepM/ murein hydrolase activator NlpD
MCFLFPIKPMACETLTDFVRPVKPPVNGNDVYLTASFGMRFHPILEEMLMHTGVDWSAPIGTPVRAVEPGRIVKVGRRGTNGNIVIVDHGAGWQTLYAHLSRFDVEPGDCVQQGTIVGRVGSTGLVAGPAVHLELLQFGWPVDPLSAAGR